VLQHPQPGLTARGGLGGRLGTADSMRCLNCA
jgi:hypothetical protein